TTQYFEMFVNRALYHDGWLACSVHPPLAGWGSYEKDEWELFNLEADRAQSTNLADVEPDRLEMMKGLWFYYAGRYNGLPLDDRTALEQVLAERPQGGPPRQQYVFYPGTADVPEAAGPAISGRSYTLAAGVNLDSGDAQGVIWAAGGVAGGHALYLKDKRLCYTFNWVGSHFQDVMSDRDLTPGHHVLTAEFTARGPSTVADMPGTAGTLTLYVGTERVGQGEIVTQPGYFCVTGDGISVGRDSGSAVTPAYEAPFVFAGGTIDKVVMDLTGEPFVDHEARVMGWFMKD
ncbi:MAG TPA: arylsulfatase, partial [Acidimicrobiales bacterium]|nr:arylsulfatase [Acidimicrobiales bacterium]